jgi:hypothetical protein
MVSGPDKVGHQHRGAAPMCQECLHVELSQPYQNGFDGWAERHPLTPECLMRGWRRKEGEPLCSAFPSPWARPVYTLQGTSTTGTSAAETS